MFNVNTTFFAPFSSAPIVDFKQVNVSWVSALLLFGLRTPPLFSSLIITSCRKFVFSGVCFSPFTHAQKMKFSTKDFFSKCEEIFTFAEEILNGNVTKSGHIY